MTVAEFKAAINKYTKNFKSPNFFSGSAKWKKWKKAVKN